MAAKKSGAKKPVAKQDEATPVNVANSLPHGVTQEDVTPRVAEEPELSFDERTKVVQPFIDENGEQVNQ